MSLTLHESPALGASQYSPPVTLIDLLNQAVRAGASDLHLSAWTVPRLRVDGTLTSLEDLDAPQPEELRTLVQSFLTPEQLERLDRERQLDCSYSLDGLTRCRVNIWHERGALALTIRLVATRSPGFEDLGLPAVVAEVTRRPHGLILVTGPTGSGKTTTLTAIIDRINQERAAHIVTVEDPIEFVHVNRLALIHQREVGADVPSFAAALLAVLREDPDVVLIGELRDRETTQAALGLAESGHLTLAALHSATAAQALSRLIDPFPPHQHGQVRNQLALTLELVLAQQLLPRRTGPGLVLALEILRGIPAVRSAIRDGQLHQLQTLLDAAGRADMQTMNQALARLVAREEVALEQALARSPDPAELQRLLGGRFPARARPRA